MSLRTGLSGLNAAATDLGVTGNNVANANTVGFKKSSAHFADVYAAANGGIQVGLGTQVNGVVQSFAQGTLQRTDNPLDLAINGQGFFRLERENGSIAYSRNGQFQVDRDGFIVNDTGERLTGYDGKTAGANPVALEVPQADIPPRASTTLDAGINLPANAVAKDPALFNPTDPTTFNEATALTVYDSLGTAHSLGLFFIKDSTSAAVPPTWEVRYEIDQGAAGTTPASGTLGTLSFDSNGNLTGFAGGPLNVTAWNTGATASVVTPSFTGSTLFDAPFSVNALSSDGYASGRVSNLNIDGGGAITVGYSNGQRVSVGQVVLSDFTNPNGLAPIGGNNWTETFASGQPLTSVPGAGRLGKLQSGSVEAANVDLTAELVNLIVAQRNYQANAQTIKTEDQVLQTILNIR